MNNKTRNTNKRLLTMLKKITGWNMSTLPKSKKHVIRVNNEEGD